MSALVLADPYCQSSSHKRVRCFRNSFCADVLRSGSCRRHGWPTTQRISKVYLQPGACSDENNVITDSRESTIIVNTPRIVPNGTKMHSIHATTNANQ